MTATSENQRSRVKEAKLTTASSLSESDNLMQNHEYTVSIMNPVEMCVHDMRLKVLLLNGF